MGRPRKQGLDYFSVETTDFHSIETGALLRRHKGDGYAVVMYLKTAIFAKGHYMRFGEIEREAFCERFPWIQEEQFEAILNDCFRIGIFDEELYRTEGVLTGVEIQRQYFFATEWRIRDDKGFEYLLIKLPKAKRPASKYTTKTARKSKEVDFDAIDVIDSETSDSELDAESLGVSLQQMKEKEKKGKENKSKQEESRDTSTTRSGEACEHASRSRRSNTQPSKENLELGKKAVRSQYSTIDCSDYAAQNEFQCDVGLRYGASARSSLLGLCSSIRTRGLTMIRPIGAAPPSQKPSVRHQYTRQKLLENQEKTFFARLKQVIRT